VSHPLWPFILGLLASLALLAILLFILRLRWRRRLARSLAAEDLAQALLDSQDELFDYDVFMCYRRVDFAICDLVVALLQKDGVRVFSDRQGHMTGLPFDKELGRAISSSACFCPIVTLAGTEALLCVTADRVDYTLVEVLLALHWQLSGRIERILPLLVGVEVAEPFGGSARPRRDMLEDNPEWRRMRKELPDVVPHACISHAAAVLRSTTGEELLPQLRSASVRQLMNATEASAAAQGGGLAAGLLTFDWLFICGLAQDVQMYVQRLAKALKRRGGAEQSEGEVER